MRSLLLLLLFPVLAPAQSPAEKKATVDFLVSLRDNNTGAYKPTPDGKPTLRATNGVIKALNYLGEKPAYLKDLRKFVLCCYDEKSGAFAEPGAEPDAMSTAVGIILGLEVGLTAKDFSKAMDYLLEKAKTFEEVRLAAAAVEVWGTKEMKLDGFRAVVSGEAFGATDDARRVAGVVVSWLRLKSIDSEGLRAFQIEKSLRAGQCDDGGWRKQGEENSDLETSYRVMRAFKMLEAKPKEIPALRKFLAARRNKDGGYGNNPGEASNASATYFAVTIGHWLDAMAK